VNEPHAYPLAAHASSMHPPVQRGFDVSVPNVARIYDALLGGCFL
jgi:hypothetical protein